jgi:hypothetical protein
MTRQESLLPRQPGPGEDLQNRVHPAVHAATPSVAPHPAWAAKVGQLHALARDVYYGDVYYGRRGGCYQSASATRGRIEKVPESEGTDARLG